MKRKLSDPSVCDDLEDDLFLTRPAKRITMCYNTPKQAKDEKKKLMKTSKKKLRQMEHPEANLRRSVLVNNVYKKLQSELKQDKSTKYYGYAFNPKCPFGFGAGPRELAQRKKLAKLEDVLSKKNKNVAINHPTNDSQHRRVEHMKEQLLRIVGGAEDHQLGSGTEEYSANLDNHQCNKDLSDNMDTSDKTDNSAKSCCCDTSAVIIDSCDSFQSVDKVAITTSSQDILQSQPSSNDELHHQQPSCDNTTVTQMECDTSVTSCDSTDLLQCSPVIVSNPTETNSICSDLASDSDNEEIDVCSVEEDEDLSSHGLVMQSVAVPLVVPSHNLHRDTELNVKQLNCSEYAPYQSSQVIDHTNSINPNKVHNQGERCTGQDFPPKASPVILKDKCTQCDSKRVESGDYSSRAFPFTSDSLAPFTSTYYTQGQLQTIYGQLGHSVGPFCQPLLCASPLYQSFASSYYSQSFCSSSFYSQFQGYSNQQYTSKAASIESRHIQSVNMVTCT